MDSLGPCRMVEEPRFDEPVWIGVGEVHLTAFFEIIGCYLVGVRNDSVGDFDAVAIGFVLEVATDGVDGWRREKCQQGDHKYQSW